VLDLARPRFDVDRQIEVFEDAIEESE